MTKQNTAIDTFFDFTNIYAHKLSHSLNFPLTLAGIALGLLLIPGVGVGFGVSFSTTMLIYNAMFGLVLGQGVALLAMIPIALLSIGLNWLYDLALEFICEKLHVSPALQSSLSALGSSLKYLFIFGTGTLITAGAIASAIGLIMPIGPLGMAAPLLTMLPAIFTIPPFVIIMPSLALATAIIGAFALPIAGTLAVYTIIHTFNAGLSGLLSLAYGVTEVCHGIGNLFSNKSGTPFKQTTQLEMPRTHMTRTKKEPQMKSQPVFSSPISQPEKPSLRQAAEIQKKHIEETADYAVSSILKK